VAAKTCSGTGSGTCTNSTVSCNGFECANNKCPTTCDLVTNAGCLAPRVCLLGTRCE
jgi:hypothetical protein